MAGVAQAICSGVIDFHNTPIRWVHTKAPVPLRFYLGALGVDRKYSLGHKTINMLFPISVALAAGHFFPPAAVFPLLIKHLYVQYAVKTAVAALVWAVVAPLFGICTYWPTVSEGTPPVRYELKESRSHKLTKLLLPIIAAAAAFYFCPTSVATSLAGRAFVALGTQLVVRPVIGVLMDEICGLRRPFSPAAVDSDVSSDDDDDDSVGSDDGVPKIVTEAPSATASARLAADAGKTKKE